jgi:hypothetical protein
LFIPAATAFGDLEDANWVVAGCIQGVSVGELGDGGAGLEIVALDGLERSIGVPGRQEAGRGFGRRRRWPA